MALTSGTKLGPYEILSPLGAGGMGEVYRAKDTLLDRTVAIKVLPSHLSSNPELKQRMEGAEIEVGTPQRLFHAASPGIGIAFDAFSDGQSCRTYLPTVLSFLP